ncbi:MAG: peptidyl-prolyl cis-trans isomerase [Thermoanaerobaculum sp.]|nr:peptidyl-prolyl cis-trans isomerase [Thermoanaerobaculum sp.]
MLKIMRENLKHLKWVLWFVVFVFVLLIFVDWGAGRLRGGGMEHVAARVAGIEISEKDFLREVRQLDERLRSLYGQQYDLLRSQLDLGQLALNNLLNNALLVQQAKKLKLQVSDEEVAQRILTFPVFRKDDGSFVGEEVYTRILAANQTTPEEFEAELREGLLIEKLQKVLRQSIVFSDAEVDREYRKRNESATFQLLFVTAERYFPSTQATEAEAKAYYETHQAQFTHGDQIKLRYLLVDPLRLRQTLPVDEGRIAEYYQTHLSEFQEPESVHARHILIRPEGEGEPAWAKAQERAEAVLQKAKIPGADFAALAREYSEDPGSKDSGGDLGWFERGRMVPEFEQAVFSMGVGEVKGPVRSQFGFHIIRLEGKKPARQKPLEEVREQVRFKLSEGLADAEASRRATALREKISAGKLTSEEQWRGLADQVVSSHLTPFFSLDEGTIPGLGRDPAMVEELKKAEEGFLGGPRRTPRGWVVYRVEGKRKAGLTPFAEAKEEAMEGARRLKALERVRSELAARRGEPLAQLATSYGVSLTPVKDHHRGSSIPGVGVAPQLEEAVFATAVGAVSEVVVVGERGVALAQVEAKKVATPEELAAGRAALRKSLVEEELSKLMDALLAEAKRNQPVTINRELVERFKPSQG